MNHRQPLLDAFNAVSTARRDYLAAYDAAQLVIATQGSKPDEREAQTLGAIVRTLDGATRELRETLAALRQLDDIRA